MEELQQEAQSEIQQEAQPETQSTIDLKNVLESLLFIARKPLNPKELEQTLSMPKAAIGETLELLCAEYEGKGINVVKVAGGYLMGTNPANADYIHGLLHAKVETRLSAQSLETLAIISYKQPITQVEVERIRGVNSDGPINTLLAKKLIEELGRSEAVGRPYLYGTTTFFLRHFGLKDLSTLPPLPVAADAQEAIFKSALHE